MRAKRILHRNTNRIRLDFEYNQHLISEVKKISGAQWSQTMHSWHIPDSAEAKQMLFVLFPDIVIEGDTADNQENKLTESHAPSIKPGNTVQSKEVKVEVIGRKIILKLPKNPSDIRFINTLKYSRWNKEHFLWEVPDYPGNTDLIKDYFKDRMGEIIYHETADISGNQKQISAGKNELVVFKTRSKRLRIIFGFNNELTGIIKSYPYSSWDKKNKWWSIPYSEIYLSDIQKIAADKGLRYIYNEEPTDEPGVRRLSPFDIANYRLCPEEMLLKLTELRYSENTFKTYKNLFEEFINFYHRYEINQISEQQIIAFLRYLVMDRKVSTSYQNQAINAIKFYYEKVLGGQRRFYFIERPRKEKNLPVVLSTPEVAQLLKKTSNIKHKCVFMLSYASGLRIGEIIKLRLEDIDRERMQIFIRQSKGNKDHYTILSVKFLELFDQYLQEYRPKEYAFEGASGGKYSRTSIENTIKASAGRAGIEKNVTMHTLRHTFGTHCLEEGIDLRYIQSMMGHASSKTTEIYTHITTKGFSKLKSPLDELEL